MKVCRQMRQLESSLNPEATKLVEQIEQGREILLDQVNLTLFSGVLSNEEPTTLIKHGIIKILKLEKNGEKLKVKSFKKIARK